MNYHQKTMQPSSQAKTGDALSAVKPRAQRNSWQSTTTTTPTTARHHRRIHARWVAAVACAVLLATLAIELCLAATTWMLLYGPSLY